jgi:hypothetical protein
VSNCHRSRHAWSADGCLQVMSADRQDYAPGPDSSCAPRPDSSCAPPTELRLRSGVGGHLVRVP